MSSEGGLFLFKYEGVSKMQNPQKIAIFLVSLVNYLFNLGRSVPLRR